LRAVRVLPDVRAVSRRFDYAVPDKWDTEVRVGSRVRIELHGRRVGGWVVEDPVEPAPGLELKPLKGLSGMGPPASVIELAQWAAWRWCGPLSALLTVASPGSVVRDLPALPSPVVSRPGALTDGPFSDLVSAAFASRGAATCLRIPPTDDLLPVVERVIDQVDSDVEGSVLVLLPNVGWGERMVVRLARRDRVVGTTWAQAAAGWPVFVGSRAAAFAPLPRIGAVVVLDAHDEAYREERSPQFDAVEVVAKRASMAGAPCLLVSPCPTAVQAHRYAVSTPDKSRERNGWPAVSIVDRRGSDPRTGLLSAELVSLWRRVAPEGRLIVVLDRKGRERVLACAACGALARCEVCGRPVEKLEDRYSCRSCGATRPVVCMDCGSARPKALRVGVDRVREELEALLGVPVGEVTGPDVQPVPSERVLVGTQAVLFRVRQANAVVFLDFDQHLLAARLGASEQALALLVRAGRLVGGRSATGSGIVMVQTRVPDHEVLSAAVNGDPGRVLEPDLAVREQLALPPFTAMASISGPGGAELAALLGADKLEVSAVGENRWLVRAQDHERLCNSLSESLGMRSAKAVKERVNVVIDPLSL